MKKFSISLFLFMRCLCYAEKDLSLPSPYNEVDILPPHFFTGWFLNHQQLQSLISEHHVSEIVELGSWLGASAIDMAKLLPQNGKIYCVDHWEGSVEHKTTPEYREYLPTLYEQFLSNVIHAKQTDRIIPVRMSTVEAARKLDVHPQLVYIDASHDKKSVYRDICDWYPKLAPGGILCGDDWTAYPSVASAVFKYAKKHRIPIHSSGNFWHFPPKP